VKFQEGSYYIFDDRRLVVLCVGTSTSLNGVVVETDNEVLRPVGHHSGGWNRSRFKLMVDKEYEDML
jgi:hypothetical protein